MLYFHSCKLLTLMTGFLIVWHQWKLTNARGTLTKWKHYFRYSKDCKIPLKVCLLSQADLKISVFTKPQIFKTYVNLTKFNRTGFKHTCCAQSHYYSCLFLKLSNLWL